MFPASTLVHIVEKQLYNHVKLDDSDNSIIGNGELVIVQFNCAPCIKTLTEGCGFVSFCINITNDQQYRWVYKNKCWLRKDNIMAKLIFMSMVDID